MAIKASNFIVSKVTDPAGGKVLESASVDCDPALHPDWTELRDAGLLTGTATAAL